MNVTAQEKAFVGRSYAYASILIPSWLLSFSHNLKHTLFLAEGHQDFGTPKKCLGPQFGRTCGSQDPDWKILVPSLIGQMAVAIALLGFNDLGCSVTPTFLFRNRFNLQLSPHCPKLNKKSMWEVKKILRFLSSGHGILPSCGCKAHETMVAKCELVL